VDNSSKQMQQTSGSSSCNIDGAEPGVEEVAVEEVAAVVVFSLLMVCGNCDQSICSWLNGGGLCFTVGGRVESDRRIENIS
jgi:hypothetical protein